MEQKNNVAVISALMLIVGVVVGWLIWGNQSANQTVPTGSQTGTHTMHDGIAMEGNDMASMMAAMNANLSGKTGDAFDQAFITEMIMHHEGAVSMAQLALTNAKHDEIKDLANAIIKAQTTEIDHMKSWQKNWYDSNK